MNVGKLARVIFIRPASEPVPEEIDLSELEEIAVESSERKDEP